MRLSTANPLTNILAVARREFVTRVRTRTFQFSTLLLIVASAAVALAPIGIEFLGRERSHVAVYVDAADLHGDPVAIVEALLNPTHDPGLRSSFDVSRSTDMDASRQQVADGAFTALLAVERDEAGEVTFTLFTKAPDDSSTAVIARQAAMSIAVADRLGRLGLSATDTASLFAPPRLTVRSPYPSIPAASAAAAAQETADAAVMFSLQLFLLVAIVLYGNWVAQSTVEEKSSRMIEIVLVAASPFQLLAGKVLGVSAAALLQFGALLAAAVVALIAQGQVAAVVLGDVGGTSLPSGLEAPLLAGFTVFFILGFLLYAVLFAAAGSLVSRQEDIPQVVQPMTLIVCAGYFLATYSSVGLLDGNAPWAVLLSWVPFLSPSLMVSRLGAGSAGPLEVAGSVALLVASILLITWIASRIYAAGVLMYGQKPSLRGMRRALQGAR